MSNCDIMFYTIYFVDDIKPINFVEKAKIPCYILAATKDDYINIKHAEQIGSSYAAPCHVKFFEGGHFGKRECSRYNR